MWFGWYGGMNKRGRYEVSGDEEGKRKESETSMIYTE